MYQRPNIKLGTAQIPPGNMFPYRLMTAASFAGAYLVSSGRIPQWPAIGFVSAFTALWTLQLLLWALWAVILYPKLFSPLRGLPEPTGNSWFMGQFKTIRKLPTGVPMIEWYACPPKPPTSCHLVASC